MGFRWLASVALGVTVHSSPVAAQDAKTAEGAQRFLAATAPKIRTLVQFVDAAGRTNYVTGKYTGDVTTTKGGLRKTKTTVEPLPQKDVDKQLSDVRAAVLEPIDAYGRPNACATRITTVTAPPYDEVKSDTSDDTRSFSWTLTQTNEAWKYEPLTKFMSPAQVIDWTNVRIYRGANGEVTVSSKGQSFRTVHLTLYAADPDQADRIEYAMKFLMMSCGEGDSIRL
jgi:hypothetical protein